MSQFTEVKLEETFTQQLVQQSFPRHLGITINRKPDEVLIEEGLHFFY